MGILIAIKDFEMPNTCGDCPYCIYTADEKRYIGYCNTSDDDYFCKALDRFMEYDKVDGGVDILGKPLDCPLVEAIPKSDYNARLKADMVAMLTEIQLACEKNTVRWYVGRVDGKSDDVVLMETINDIIQQKINDLKRNK